MQKVCIRGIVVPFNLDVRYCGWDVARFSDISLDFANLALLPERFPLYAGVSVHMSGYPRICKGILACAVALSFQKTVFLP
jgi:hypothetical protein